MRRKAPGLLAALVVLRMALALLPGTAFAAESTTANLTPEIASAYLDTVESLFREYGAPVRTEITWDDAPACFLCQSGDAAWLDCQWESLPSYGYVSGEVYGGDTETTHFRMEDGAMERFAPQTEAASTARTSGGTVQMDTAAVIVSGRTCAPVRYLAEYFGYEVGWDASTNTVIIK